MVFNILALLLQSSLKIKYFKKNVTEQISDTIIFEKNKCLNQCDGWCFSWVCDADSTNVINHFCWIILKNAVSRGIKFAGPQNRFP